ncbi:hypothetical protein ACSMEV_18185 [Pseudomonas sp. MLB6B]
MKLEDHDINHLRTVIAEFKPDSSSTATRPLSLDELYTPPTHKAALDFERSLIVGNRGTGKSVWSGALANEKTRKDVAKRYSYDFLNSTEVELGFHQNAAEVEGVAPSPKVLSRLLKCGFDSESIWTAVLLKATKKYSSARIKSDFSELVEWVDDNPAKCEELLRKADNYFRSQNKKFILVFDALDRLGKSWEEIRPLTRGVLTLALGMQGYSCMRAKVFMRTDQYKDKTVFAFPDASKLTAAKVELRWHPTELYGLFFQQLHKNPRSETSFAKIYKAVAGSSLRAYSKIEEPDKQREAFTLIAGEYMGSDHRRGRTYTWIIDHLADAFQETTPRSFLVTLQRAASVRQKPSSTVIDHHGIREGVQSASEIRVAQLSEDYPWIEQVLTDLAGLEVPCSPDAFVARWKERKTVKEIYEIETDLPGPVELSKSSSDEESLLLDSLENIGVVEYRTETKINMPDIFRVAARIKRRGGVKTPNFSRSGK